MNYLQKYNIPSHKVNLMGQSKQIADEFVQDICGIRDNKTPKEHLQELNISLRLCLAGSPGVGKTALANEVARMVREKKLGLSYTVNCSALLSSDFGGSPKNVAAMFGEIKEVSKKTRVFVFIDEADSIWAHRTESNDHRDGNRALTESLKGLDQLDPTRVFLIAATNRIDIIDSAIRRRLDVVEIHSPPKQVLKEYMMFANNRYGIDMSSFIVEKILDSTEKKPLTISALKRQYAHWVKRGMCTIHDMESVSLCSVTAPVEQKRGFWGKMAFWL